MTRSDLVTRLAERFSQLTQRDTEFAVKTILDAMSDALGIIVTCSSSMAPVATTPSFIPGDNATTSADCR